MLIFPRADTLDTLQVRCNFSVMSKIGTTFSVQNVLAAGRSRPAPRIEIIFPVSL
jgi:hypothetical protein